MNAISKLVYKFGIWVAMATLLLSFFSQSLYGFIFSVIILIFFARIIFELENIVPLMRDLSSAGYKVQDRLSLFIQMASNWIVGLEINEIRIKFSLYNQTLKTRDQLMNTLQSLPYLDMLQGKEKDLFLLSHLHHDVHANGLMHFFLHTSEDILNETVHVLKKHNLQKTMSIFQNIASYGLHPHQQSDLTDKDYNFLTLSNLKFHQAGAKELQTHISRLYA